MTSVSRYHVDVLARVKQFRVFIWTQHVEQTRIGCKFADATRDTLLLVLFDDLDKSVSAIPIPSVGVFDLQLETSQITKRDAYISCTFEMKFKENDHSSYLWRSHHPADEVLPLSSVPSISCKVCRSTLLKQPSNIEKISIMPSEHWEDMRELWTCACTSHFLGDKLPRSTVVRAVSHTLQVGPSYLQLHGSDLFLPALMLDPEEPHTVAFHRNWKNLYCVRCRAVLGQAEMPNADTIGKLLNTDHEHHHDDDHHVESSRATSSTEQASSLLPQPLFPESSSTETSLIDSILYSNVKLDKHALSANQDLFQLHRLETKVSMDILALVSISGCLRFVLRDSWTRKPHLLLTVLGWDSATFSSTEYTVDSADHAYLTLMPSIRLCYKIISANDAVLHDASSEIIEFDSFSLESIAHLLQQRHAYLPSEIASIGMQPVSYLYYVPPER